MHKAFVKNSTFVILCILSDLLYYITRGDKMLFICYPKCSTCAKALAYADSLKLKYDFRDIKTENPTYEELREWYKKSGLELKRFFNTSGLVYKQLQLKDKLPQMSEEEQLRLLATDGMLVKRPLVIGEDFVLTGFKEKEWKAVFEK